LKTENIERKCWGNGMKIVALIRRVLVNHHDLVGRDSLLLELPKERFNIRVAPHSRYQDRHPGSGVWAWAKGFQTVLSWGVCWWFGSTARLG